MSLSGDLRAQRLRHLHTTFLAASAESPPLYHVAIRPHDPELWTIVSLDWTQENPQENPSCWDEEDLPRPNYGADSEDFGDLPKLNYGAHEHWWKTSIASSKWRTRQSAYLVEGVHRLVLPDGQWAGRYTCPELTKWGCCFRNGKRVMVPDIIQRFERMAGDALFDILLLEECEHPVPSPTYEHIRGWLEYLYQVFPQDPEDLKTVLLIGLPWNVFDTSARAIEMLLNDKTLSGKPGVRKRTADSKTDKPRKLQPENKDVAYLCRMLGRELPTGRQQIDIALELTKGDKKKANNLLRQARRFPHFWKQADK